MKMHLGLFLKYIPDWMINDRFVYEYMYCLVWSVIIFCISYCASLVLEKNKYINRFIFGKFE